jgi:Ca2+-binding RTX toxin-like protein
VAGDAATVGHDTFTGGVNAAIGSNFADVYDAHLFNSGFNTFQGNAGDDQITGNGATQLQYGNAASGMTITIGAGGSGSVAGDTATVGHDSLVSGVNSVIGGNFADVYDAHLFNSGFFNSFQGQGGDDQITGNGATQVQYGTATSGVTITIGAGGAGSAQGTEAGDAATVGHDTFTGGVNTANGSNFDDAYDAHLFNSGFFNSFLGQGGNDTITGNGATQIQYNNATGGVSVNLSTGIATGDASVGTDTITGGVNNVLGSNLADTIIGSSANETLNGNGGNDTLNGGGGADTLIGGAGNDNFVFASGSTAGATIVDFVGNGAAAGDSLEFHGFGTATDGASLTFLSGVQWQVHSGLDGHNEIITLNGTTAASVHPTDYQFLV